VLLRRAFVMPLRSRGGRAWARRLLMLFGGLALLWLLLFAVVWVRLVAGDQRLDWLMPQVVASLNDRLPDQYSAEAQGLALSRRGGRIHLELDDLVVRDGARVPVFQAGKSRVGFSLGGLMTGRIEARSVGLIEPVIAVNAAEDGSDTVIRPQDMVAAAFNVLRLDGGLRELNLQNAVVEVPGTGSRLYGVNVRMFPERDRARSIVIEANGAPEDAEPWAIGGRFSQRTDGGLTYEVGFADIVPDLVLGEDSAFSLSSAISGQLMVATYATGEIADASYAISLAPGEVQLPGNIQLPVGEIEINGRFDPNRRVVVVLPSRLDIASSTAVFAGEFSFPGKESLLYGTIPMSFGFNDLNIEIGEERGRVPLDAVIFEAQYDTYAQQARIRRFDFLSGQTSVSMLGTIAKAPGSPAIRLRGGTADMPVLELEKLWPVGVAPNSRRWLLKHVRSGLLTNANLSVDIPGGVLASLENIRDLPSRMARIDFSVEDMLTGYFKGLPDMYVEAARGRLSLSSFELEMTDQGVIELPSDRTVTLTQGSFRVAGHAPQTRKCADPVCDCGRGRCASGASRQRAFARGAEAGRRS
jgi:hypothetical protein